MFHYWASSSPRSLRATSIIFTDLVPRFFTLASSGAGWERRSVTDSIPAFCKAFEMRVGRSSSSIERLPPEDAREAEGAESVGWGLGFKIALKKLMSVGVA